MSLKTLPILFINMGGEMMYILDQRLTAQGVKRDKAAKVLTDIVSTMFGEKLMGEIFKPQDTYSRRAMRQLFDKIAHTSIMRLNTTSMDKLYDLMTMAVKYQLQAAGSPTELVIVTLNHLDGMRKMVPSSEPAQRLLDGAYKAFMVGYGQFDTMQLQIVRQTFLSFYQDSRVKVSILLRENRQLQSGYFAILTDTKLAGNIKKPGTINYYKNEKPVKQSSFSTGGKFQPSNKIYNTDRLAPPEGRGCEIGGNMYREQAPIVQEDSTAAGSGNANRKQTPDKLEDTLAKEELKLLSMLVGSSKESNKSNFTLNLFANDDDDAKAGPTGSKQPISRSKSTDKSKVVKVEVKREKSVDKVMADLSTKDHTKLRKTKSRGEEMLEMMDEAS